MGIGLNYPWNPSPGRDVFRQRKLSILTAQEPWVNSRKQTDPVKDTAKETGGKNRMFCLNSNIET